VAQREDEGGVASSSGDFWCIRTLALLRFCDSPFEAGAKAATVGFGSLERASLSLPWPRPWSGCESVMEDIQGVSARRVLISRLNFLRSGILAGWRARPRRWN
jgi:hypothetical protein